MFTGSQRLAAALGGPLLLIAILFPPVWFDGAFIPFVNYVFIGTYFRFKNTYGESVDLVWLVWLIHLCTIVMATLGALLDFGADDPPSSASRLWLGMCVVGSITYAYLLSTWNGHAVISALKMTYGSILIWFVLFFVALFRFLGSCYRAAREGRRLLDVAVVKAKIRNAKVEAQYRFQPFPFRSVMLGVVLVMTCLGTMHVRAVLCQNGLNSELIQAVEQSDTRKAKVLLALGANSNASRHIEQEQSAGDQTVLGIAAEKGELPMVQLLIGNGANPRVPSFLSEGDSYMTPVLSIAVMYDHKDVAAFLLNRGADINARAQFGDQAIHEAVRNKDVLQLLLDKGADVNARGWEGDTALMFAVSNPDAEVTRYLLRRGGDVNIRGDVGQTALLFAAENGRTGTVRLLLQRGADVSATTIYGDTVLHDTTDKDVIKMLKQAGAKE